MKRLLFAFVLILLLSCESDKSPFELPDDNWGPTDLQLERLDPTTVKLTWKDNSEFEDGFVIDKRILYDNWSNWIEGYHFLSSNETTFVDSLIDWTIERIEYRIKAYYEYDYSNYTSQYIYISNSSPDNLEAIIQSDYSKKLTWNDNSEGEDNFIIDKYIPGSGWIEQYQILSYNINEFVDDESTELYGIYDVYATHNGIKSSYTEAIVNVDSLKVLNFELSSNSNCICIENDIAYLCGGHSDNSLYIYNISNPVLPEMIANCNIYSYTWHDATDITFYENKIYLITTDHFLVIDVTDPDSPEVIGNCDIYYLASEIDIKDNYAFIADYYSGLTVVDISNPSLPVIVGNCEISHTRDVVVIDNIAYVSYHYGLKIVDITIPESPIIIGDSETGGLCNIFIKENYVYSDCFDIIDISDPGNPVLVGISPSESGYDIAISGDFAYIVSNWNLKIFQISDLEEK